MLLRIGALYNRNKKGTVQKVLIDMGYDID